MTIEQTIRVRGYSFQVESDRPLTQHQKDILFATMGQFSQSQIKLLAEGKPGEPPLSFVIADRFRSSLFRGRWGVDGEYHVSENKIFFDRLNIPSERGEEGDQDWFTQYAKGAIAHEIGHVLDDFAVTRYENFTMNEVGLASTEYENRFAVDKNCRQSEPFQFFISDQGFGNHFGRIHEDVASIIAYLQNPTRYDRMKAVLKNHFKKECVEVADQCLSPIEFEAQDPFIQSVKVFLDRYPQIPGVSLEEQHDIGIWLPIVRVRVW